jgi:pyranose oxidase
MVSASLIPISVVPAEGNIPNLDPSAYWERQSVRNNINPGQNPLKNLPSGMVSYAVGGMGNHWTCAVPRLHPTLERWNFISHEEWDRLYEISERDFITHTNVFENSIRNRVIKNELQKHYQGKLSDEYPIQNLPVSAYRRMDDPRFVHWGASADILRPILMEESYTKKEFEVKAQHLAQSLYTDKGGKIKYAKVLNLAQRQEVHIYANEFIIAAGAIMTPQILWNSDIRPRALGRYLNDQPLVFTQIVLSKSIVEQMRHEDDYDACMKRDRFDEDRLPIPMYDPDPALWIPVQEGRPWHAQIHKDAFNYGRLADNVDDRLIVDFRWFGMTEPLYENCVKFESNISNIHGMPQPTFEYIIPDDAADRAHKMM